MKRLIYRSHASADLRADDVFSIIQEARAGNASVGLSGFLLLRDKRFMQWLEGDARALDELFAKVRVDRRHYDVEVLFEDRIDALCFPNWRMQRISADDADTALEALRKHEERPVPPREARIVEDFLGHTDRPQTAPVAA